MGTDEEATKKYDDEKTSSEDNDFKHLASLRNIRNVALSHLIRSTGESYLETIYIMNLTAPDWNETKRLEFAPTRIKIKSGDRIAAYYHKSSSELDLIANTFKD